MSQFSLYIICRLHQKASFLLDDYISYQMSDKIVLPTFSLSVKSVWIKAYRVKTILKTAHLVLESSAQCTTLSQWPSQLCPEPLTLIPRLWSQITHQCHFIPLAYTTHQSDGRVGRNRTVDWLIGGKGVEQLRHPLTTAACCEMSEHER